MPAEPAAYRPVIVIPVYNHPATVEDVVRRLLSTGTPVLLVDDASDPPAQEACERCRAMGAGLVRRQSTGGRGASILTGFKAARQAGFTHALVFDAGGRHDPAAVGSFLELSRKHSNDLVCGYARTSSAYPARARLARRMADAGACLAALSLAPKDVMCRLRVYPLAAVSHRTRQTRRIRIRVTRAPHVDGTSPARASRRSQTARRRRLPLPARARHAPHRRHERQALHHHAHEAPRRADLPFHGLVARPGTRLRAPSSTSVQESIR